MKTLAATIVEQRARASRWHRQVIVVALLALGSATGHAQATGMLSSHSAAPAASPDPASAATLAAAVRAAGESAAQQAATPTMTAGPDGFVLQSPTGEYRLQLGLLLQADGRFAPGDDQGDVADTFAMRRIRPYLRGTLARRFEFYLNPDFAGGTLVLQDAYVDTRFSPAFIVRLGKGKTPFGLERLIPAANVQFFERALPTALVPNRDVGVQVLGDLRGGRVSYAAAVMNGVPDGASGDLDNNDGKDLAGRIAIRPFGPPGTAPGSGLTIALAGTTGNHVGLVTTIRTPSLLQNFVTYTGASADGRLNRYSPGASYYFHRVAALAEYVHTNMPVRRDAVREEVAHDAWQIAGSYVLTAGDTVTERGVRPLHNFDFGNGHLGALQVVARYHQLTVDQDAFLLGLAAPGSSREARAWTLGLNWFLTPNLRYLVNFERTVFDGHDAAARHPENVVAFRAQVNF